MCPVNFLDCKQSQADPAKNHPDQGTVAGASCVGSSAAAANGAQAGNRSSRLRVCSCPPENGLTPYICMPVTTCGHDVQFRTPSVLDLAPAEDTVSQVNQVSNV